MKTANYNNNQQHTSTYSGSLMFMESHERKHLEQSYESVKESLLCFGKESNYLDSEFCSTLEEKGHGDFLL